MPSLAVPPSAARAPTAMAGIVRSNTTLLVPSPVKIRARPEPAPHSLVERPDTTSSAPPRSAKSAPF